MKTKNNMEPKKYVLIGKGYIDYLEIEFTKGNMNAKEVIYWKGQNRLYRKEQSSIPACSRISGNTKKLIPYNS